MSVDPYILTFSALTVIATIWMGFWAARKSKTAHDFFVAGRNVSVGWNASAISGEYLSAASFMGVAGMVMSSGYDALWYPVCYACGYLFLLLFIAGPLRRFGAYTIPDFAEGRYDSPVFRKIAVIFVLFIGFFYTMPQMKGAGTTLAYIFPGLPYWAGVVVVGAVITLNVALGGMKGITLVQAFQYWAKMFAISVPIFVLMAVYGHYGKHLEQNFPAQLKFERLYQPPAKLQTALREEVGDKAADIVHLDYPDYAGFRMPDGKLSLGGLLKNYGLFQGKAVYVAAGTQNLQRLVSFTTNHVNRTNYFQIANPLIAANGFKIVHEDDRTVRFVGKEKASSVSFSPELTLTDTNLTFQNVLNEVKTKTGFQKFTIASSNSTSATLQTWLFHYAALAKRPSQTFTVYYAKPEEPELWTVFRIAQPRPMSRPQLRRFLEGYFETNGVKIVRVGNDAIKVFPTSKAAEFAAALTPEEERLSEDAIAMGRAPLPAKAPKDETWLSPFGPLTTKAAKAAAAALTNRADLTTRISLRADLPQQRMTVPLNEPNLEQAFEVYSYLTGRQRTPIPINRRLDAFFGYRLSQWGWVRPRPTINIAYHSDALSTAAEVKEQLESIFQRHGIRVMPEGDKHFRAVKLPGGGATDAQALAALQKSWLETHERPLALLYTYSLIIALVCGTAGLPHILVRFYTNPDGVAAKRTTMWVMILIGVFYVFPPVFGVIGRNLLPELYSAVGAKGTDKVVLELPRILNDRFAPLGSILSGITCAGAFAAFMSTFSGLLVSMTGALAHDVYGRMLRPQSTPDQRMKAFKICAVVVGAVAIFLGTRVEQFQINFMVGQAFAIAAASYFPLLFMSAWWRGMTMRGAATGMLAGGLLALCGITLTSFTDLKWLPLDSFWAAHPLLRILCEQPAIWAVPLAISLMIAVSKMTRREIPSDVRMKMLVLHAPEKLGLKQEYIAEHQAAVH